MFSKQQPRDPGPHVAIIVGDGTFEFPIVGESHYQDNIEGIAGRKTEHGAHHECIAVLIPEPTNPYDPHAVRVGIQGKTVGYLSRDIAGVFLSDLSNGGFAAAVASAKIVGGWDRGGNDVGSFGVKLNAAMPFVFSIADSGIATILEVPSPLDASTLPDPPSAAALALLTKKPKRERRRRWPAVLLILILVIIAFNIFGSNSRAERIVAVLNSQFGRICDAKIEGLFSDTLRLDWTAETKK